MTAHDNPSRSELESRFRSLRSWNQRDKWSPKKPLLVVWMIGRCLAGKKRLVSFAEADRELRKLWTQFGPPRPLKTEQPFWRLRKDNVWEVPEEHLIKETGSNDAFITCLKEHNATGGFPEYIFNELRKDKDLSFRLARDLVDAHFPGTRQDEVLKAAGVEAEYVTSRRKVRDPSFRPRVLEAYDHRCAVCELSISMDEVPIAVEAAHIKWHQASGPDEVRNGLSLCNLHHKLFDAGAFTTSLEGTVQVSGAVQGTGLSDALGRYATKPLLKPEFAHDAPARAFVEWHWKEIFRGKAM